MKESQTKLPTGNELVQGVQRYFEEHTLPKLKEHEEWCQRSRRVDIQTCPPGGCPKPGEYPSYPNHPGLDEWD